MKTPLTPALLAELRRHDESEPLPAEYDLPRGCTPRYRTLIDGTVVPSVLARIDEKYCPSKVDEHGKLTKQRLSWRRPWTYGGLADAVEKLLDMTPILKAKRAAADKAGSPLFIPSLEQAEKMYFEDPDTLSRRALKACRMHIKRFRQHVGSAVLVTAITSDDIQGLIDAEQKRGLSRQSLFRQKAAISSFLSWLVKKKKVSAAERLEMMAGVEVPKSARKDKRKRALLTVEEYFQLIDCKKVPLRDRALYIFAYAYGARASDSFAALWGHVDTVNWSHVVIVRPKTDADPVIHDLKPDVAAVLKEWFMASGRPAADRPVFGRIKQGKDPRAVPGSKVKDTSSGARRLRKHLLLAGVKRHELHHDVERTDSSVGSRRADLHSFRRLLATGLARAGVGTKDAMEIMGWSTPSMYARYQQAEKVQKVPDAALPQRPLRTPETVTEKGG